MTLESVSRRIESHFITVAVILSGVALAYPPSFTWIKPHIPLGLGIIMFGMGLTLEFGDFRDILRKWRLVGAGRDPAIHGHAPACGGDFVHPGVAARSGRGHGRGRRMPRRHGLQRHRLPGKGQRAPVRDPDPDLHLPGPGADPGPCLLGAGKAGAHRLLVHGPVSVLDRGLPAGGRADPAPSAAPPAGACPAGVSVGLHPGHRPGHCLHHRAEPASPARIPAARVLAVVLHNTLGLAAGYGMARLFRYSHRDARTLAIEVGMQNSGLGVALAVKHFGVASALPGALFSLWHNLSGVGLARRWRVRETSD